MLNFLISVEKDNVWSKDIFFIAKNYIKGKFIFDVLATVPLFTGQSSDYYWLKLIRFIQVKVVYGFISQTILSLLGKTGMNKNLTDKLGYTFNLLIYLFSAIHILGCTWIYIGQTTECSWIEGGCGASDFTIDRSDTNKMYITATYWVITTVTTVGYGDYKGYTDSEYMF